MTRILQRLMLKLQRNATAAQHMSLLFWRTATTTGGIIDDAPV